MLAKVIFSFPTAKWFVLVVERCDASLSLETLQSLTAQLHPQNVVKTLLFFFFSELIMGAAQNFADLVASVLELLLG